MNGQEAPLCFVLMVPSDASELHHGLLPRRIALDGFVRASRSCWNPSCGERLPTDPRTAADDVGAPPQRPAVRIVSPSSSEKKRRNEPLVANASHSVAPPGRSPQAGSKPAAAVRSGTVKSHSDGESPK